jgi:predicted DNA-binding protein
VEETMAKKMVSIFLEEEQIKRLDKLSAKTRVPKAAYVREGIDIALEKQEKKLKGKHKKRR